MLDLSLDNDLLILRYKHKIDWQVFFLLFFIANIIPLIAIILVNLTDADERTNGIFTPPEDVISIGIYYTAVFAFIFYNYGNIYGRIQELKGWSEFRYDEARQFIIYQEMKKHDILIPITTLKSFELRFIYDYSIWRFSAILNTNEKTKLIEGRKLPYKIAPLLAEKMALDLEIVNKPKALPEELQSRSDTIKTE